MKKWIKNTIKLYVQETHFIPRDTNTVKVEGWKKTFHASSNEKREAVAILISDKIDVKLKSYKSQRRILYINKMSNTAKTTTIINIHIPNDRLSNIYEAQN